jgi:hypothetical protein
MSAHCDSCVNYSANEEPPELARTMTVAWCRYHNRIVDVDCTCPYHDPMPEKESKR